MEDQVARHRGICAKHSQRFLSARCPSFRLPHHHRRYILCVVDNQTLRYAVSTKKIRRSRRSLPGTAGWLLGAVVLTALVSSACSPRLLRGPAGDNTPLSKINPADLTVEGLPKQPDNIQPVKLPQHGSHSLLAAPLAGMKQLRRDPIPSQNVPPNSLAQQPPGRVLLAAVTNSPFQPLGRLHVKGAAGWRWCSAQLVGSLDVILTAAHCVFDQDKADFFSDAVF